MSTIYQGASSDLHILPGEQYVSALNGLITLTREYACATSYASTAATTLVPGYAPEGYSNLKLFTVQKKTNGPITTFSCVFTGASQASLVTYTQAIRSFSYQLPVSGLKISGRYLSQVKTTSIAQAASSAAAASSWYGDAQIIESYVNGIWYDGEISLGTLRGELLSYDEQNYGNFVVSTTSWGTATQSG